MSSISKEQVEHIAKLARIELAEEEKEKFTKELSSILDYVKKLTKADISKAKRIAQITGLDNVMREDEFTPTSRRGRQKIENRKQKVEKLLKEAPQRKGDYIKVPKILE